MLPRLAENLAKALLVLLALACLAALAAYWPRSWPMSETSEVRLKGILCGLCLVLVAWRHLPSVRRRLPPRRAGAGLVLAGALSVGAYYNFGTLHGDTFVHYWEHFHYYLGAEYFPELGYDGLYAASVAAQRQTRPRLPVQPYLRDLRTNEVVEVHSPSSSSHRAEVAGHFTAERWKQFLADHRHFLAARSPAYVAEIRKDHGYNPPPSWTFVARLFTRAGHASEPSLLLLASLDVLLLVVLFTAVFSTWGSRAGCLSLVLFGLGYAGRFYWIGGAFLRLDWLAVVVVAIALVERRRYGPAGMLLGYAAVVRIFPVLFLFGPAVLALNALWRGERPRWARDLALGFALSVALGLSAGCMTGRGVHAWTEFFDSLRLHRHTGLTNNVGLDNLVLYGADPSMMDGRWVEWSLPEPWAHWQKELDRRRVARRPAVLAARVALLALLAAAAWRSSLAEAVVLSMAAVFSLTLLTCYYWILLLAVPLGRSTTGVFGALVLNLLAFGLHLRHPAFEMRYGLMSWGLTVLFLVWMLPRVRRGTCRRRSPLGVD